MELSSAAIDWLVLIGRLGFVTIFLMSGIAHFAAREAMVGYGASKGLPIPAVAVPATGLLLLAASLGIVLGVWIDIAFLALVVFLVPTALIMHAFWRLEDPMERMADQMHFNKDLSLAGAALALFALSVATGDSLGLTVTGPVLSLID